MTAPEIEITYGSSAKTLWYGEQLDPMTGEFLMHVNAKCPFCGEWDGIDGFCPCWPTEE